MLKIYIAGPYTKPDPAINVRAAMEVWHLLAAADLAPFCPHLSHFLHLHSPREYRFWMIQDFEWIGACDVLIRLPGESSGADEEVSLARKLGIPVINWDDRMRDWPAVELRSFLQTLVDELNRKGAAR